MTTQPKALRLAELFETYAIDHKPDGWPAIQQRELNAASSELRRLHADNVSYLKQIREQAKEIVKLEVENEALRKDAERYQWLRHGDNDDVVMKGDCRGVYLPRNERLDLAIDEQIELDRMKTYLTQDHVLHGAAMKEA